MHCFRREDNDVNEEIALPFLQTPVGSMAVLNRFFQEPIHLQSKFPYFFVP